MSQFAVPASSLGHHFQSHYALHLLLEVASEDPLATMTIERIDDVAIESGDGSIESVQTKQHGDDVGLGNAAPDIWKTIRAWLEPFGTAHEPALFTLVTTSVAQHGSAAYYLRPESFDPDKALLTILNAVPRISKNESNKLAYAAFEALSETDRRRFIGRIRVLDGVAPAVALTKKIHKQGHRRQAAETMDRVFAKATIGRQMVVKPADSSDQKKTPIPKKLLESALNVVEVRRLELLTPYMRSKCSTS